MADPTKTTAAADGSAVAFTSLVGFAGAVGSSLAPDYVSVRDGRMGTNGWSTHSIVPPGQEPIPFSYRQGSQATTYRLYSSDLSEGIVRAFSPLTDAPNVASVRNLYRRTDLRTSGGGAWELVTPSAGPVPFGYPGGVPDYAPAVVDASADFSHVSFESKLSLTLDAPPCTNPDYSTCPDKLYEWTPAGVRLAGVLPDGTAAVSSAAARGVTSNLSYAPHAVSDDGSRVFFTSPFNFSGAGNLYARVNETATVQLNASERTPPDASQVATYLDATPDGSQVFLKSGESLTNTDGSGLYRYDFNAPVNSRLTLLSGDVHGLLGISDDGSSVYFVGAGDNIGLWRAGGARSIGTFADGSDSFANVGALGYILAPKPGRVSPNGRFMLFSAREGTGLTGYNHGTTACDGRPCRQLYVYDADANGGAGRLACASCNFKLPSATSEASSMFSFGLGAASPRPYLNRALSDDGKVFFSTGEQLVTEDTNGRVRDVYEYDIPTGELKLISTGKSSFDSLFMDASADGNDVFFVTRERLVGWDRDDAYDIYDARVGGGFPEPKAISAPCSEDACHGSPSAPPSSRSPGSVTFISDGNSSEAGRAAAFHVLALSRHQLEAWVRTGTVRLRVRVSTAGRVRVRVLSGGKPSRVLDTAIGNSRHGGMVGVRLRLPAGVRARLRHGGRVRVSLRVWYSKAASSQHAVATLVGGTR